MSINDRISQLLKSQTGMSVEDIQEILREEGFNEDEIKLVPWGMA